MYSANTKSNHRVLPLVSALALSMGMTTLANAALEERAVYTMKILVWDDPDAVGQCSAFLFGDVSTLCASGSPSAFVDNEVPGAPALAGGNGIVGDGLAGTITIATGKVNQSGVRNFTISAFQVDPYLATAGGVFKTAMGDTSAAGGTVDNLGNMTLDPTGRTGIAQFFEGSIGEQPWNLDTHGGAGSSQPFCEPGTGIYTPFTTGSTSNTNCGTGETVLTLTGRPIGDANSDGILDAVLVSVGNVGDSWGAFDGTPYSEAFNVQFELVSGEPVARADSLATNEGIPLVIDIDADLLANDDHAMGDALSLVSFTQPAQAGSSVVDNGDGTLTYTPAAGFAGTDTFTYTIDDTTPGSPDTATVTISISAAGNNPPEANDLPVVTDEDTPLIVDPTSNDSDPDSDPLTITAFDSVSSAGGAVVDNGDGTLTYTPLANYFGADSFNYTISDGKGGVDSAQVLITVNPVNDPPVCTDVALTAPGNAELAIDVDVELLSTCTDVENDPITLHSTTQPTHGALAFDGANTLTYTPPAEFIGQDTFTYTATDGTDTAASRTVSISVGKVYGNFTMLSADGSTFGGTNDVVANWDGTFNTSEADTNFNMTLGSDSNFPFFGYVWSAHHIRVFGPGSYSFDTSCTTAQLESGIADCGGSPGQYLNLTVSEGQIGAHILFDWNVTKNIDVVLRWDMDGSFDNPPPGTLFQGPAGPTPSLDAIFEFVSRDVEGDGVPGARMIDGPFIDYRANFNLNFTRSSEGGEAGTVESTIGDPSLGGGCTLGNRTATATSRSDLLLLAGFIGWLGFMVMRRKRLMPS